MALCSMAEASTCQTKAAAPDATTLEEMEYQMIKAAIDKFSGNLSLAANQLGISRQTLYNKMKRFGL